MVSNIPAGDGNIEKLFLRCEPRFSGSLIRDKCPGVIREPGWVGASEELHVRGRSQGDLDCRPALRLWGKQCRLYYSSLTIDVESSSRHSLICHAERYVGEPNAPRMPRSTFGMQRRPVLKSLVVMEYSAPRCYSSAIICELKHTTEFSLFLSDSYQECYSSVHTSS